MQTIDNQASSIEKMKKKMKSQLRQYNNGCSDG